MSHIAATRHVVTASFVMGRGTARIATHDIERAGEWYAACIVDDVALGAGWTDAILRATDVRLSVAHRVDLGSADPAVYQHLRTTAVDGLEVLVETITTVVWVDGTEQEFVEAKTLTCTGREVRPGIVTLLLTDIEDQRLNALYPPETYTADAFPGLSPLDEGRAMPSIVGIAEKVPMARITNASPWQYLAAKRCVPASVASVVLPTLYRGSSPSDARVTIPDGNAPSGAYAGRYFTAEQRDFSGAEYRLYADISTAVFTAPQIIRQLLTDAGVTVDAASFTACETWAASNALFIDCDFGAWGQRTTRAILEDLLYVSRAALDRRDDGSYAIVYDGPATGWSDYDEDAGDPVELLSLTEPSAPAKVGIRYRPSPRDPSGALQFSILRDVPGGTQGDERPRECRYVRRHEVADKTAWYYAQRAAHAQRLRLRVYRTVHSLGDTLRITSAAWGLSQSQWRVRRVTRIVGGVELECERYSDDLVTYVPGPLPGDPGADYTPDYSNTPPAAPTSLRITAGATALAGDGATTARVTVDALPPAVNWDRLMFSAVHNVTGEIPGILRGESIGGGRHGIVLTGLRPGEVYKLLCWAENAFNVQGVVQGTFNATAIGGGASTTTFTAPGYATLPPDVPSISAAQGSARLLQVSWAAVTTANLREYVLERQVASGAWSEVWRGQARAYTDRAVSYGQTYTYRVRARDTWGNLSAGYTTTSPISLTTGTIYGGGSGNDIGANTVATGNRTAVTTITKNYTIAPTGYETTVILPHSLGRSPLALGTSSQHPMSVSFVSDLEIRLRIFWQSQRAQAPDITTASANGPGAHTHSISARSYPLDGADIIGGSGTAGINIW